MSSTPYDASGLSSVELVWLPLGAGGSVVKNCGQLFEKVVARRDHRPPVPLFHSALIIRLEGVHFVIEMTPAWGAPRGKHGVVTTGAVGSSWLGHSRFFRYEVRRWLHGEIADHAALVGTSHIMSADATHAQALLHLAPLVPALTWGRDEARLGEMWNSNSVVSWLLSLSGHSLSGISPPQEGRAPGWRAGLVLAARHPEKPFDPHRLRGIGF